MLRRIECRNRSEWLAARTAQGIGASEAAAVLGISPWMSTTQLWRLKIGADEAKDLSGTEEVERGVRVEPALRELFSAEHPEMTVEYHPFDILFQDNAPFAFATLDGELTDRKTGKRGILEIKTASPNGKAGWEKWKDDIPPHYRAQITHQFLATGFDFAFLYAALYQRSGIISVCTYEIWREDVQSDIDWLAERELRFWHCVKERTMPAMPLHI